VSWSDWTVPWIFFHAYQFQAEVAKSVKDAVKVGLIPDLADEGALLAARSQGKPLQCGRKTSGEASPDYDPVPGRLHVTPGVLWVGAHLEPNWMSGHHPSTEFTRAGSWQVTVLLDRWLFCPRAIAEVAEL
jgi:hypothetical protein